MVFLQLNPEKWPFWIAHYKDRGDMKVRTGRVPPGAWRHSEPKGRIVRKDSDGRFLHWHGEQQRYHQFDELFSLQRKFVHMIHNYRDQELPNMEKMRQLAEACEARLWAPFRWQQRTVRRVAKDTVKMYGKMQRVRNGFKVEARDFIVNLLPITCDGVLLYLDSAGRKNVLPYRMRIDAADNRIIQRIGEILQIDPWILQAQAVVKNLIRPSDYLLEACRKRSINALRLIAGIPDKFTEQRYFNILNAVHLLRFDLSQLTLRPYSTLRYYAVEQDNGELNRAAACLAGDPQESAGLIKRVAEAVALKTIRVKIEQVLLNMTPLEYVTQLKNTDLEPVPDWLRAATQGLDIITEEGFKKPVTNRTRECLAEATSILTSDNHRLTLQKKLVAAKKKIKEAAHAL